MTAVKIPFKLILELITEDGPDFRESDAKDEIVRCCVKDQLITIETMQKEILSYYDVESFAELKKENPIVITILTHYFGVILWR